MDVKIYQSFKTDEERSRYLLQKMEEDIREGLKSLDGSGKTEKEQEGVREKAKDTYPWLQVKTQHQGLQPKLKHKLMHTYQSLVISSALKVFRR